MSQKGGLYKNYEVNLMAKKRKITKRKKNAKRKFRKIITVEIPKGSGNKMSVRGGF